MAHEGHMGEARGTSEEARLHLQALTLKAIKSLEAEDSDAKLKRLAEHIVHGVGKLLDSKLQPVLEELKKMATNMDRLTTEVEENSSAIDSAIVLINGLAQMVRELQPNQAAINALADKLDAKANALADAVVANTPTEEPPAEPPV